MSTDEPQNDQQIVLVHGFGADSHVWDCLVEDLRGLGSISALDLPGHGEMGATTRWLLPTLDPAVDELLFAGLNGAVGIGWSLGAGVLLKTAADNPGLFSKLILVAPAYCFVKREGFPFGLEDTVVRKMLIDITVDTVPTLKRFYRLIFTGGERRGEVAAAFFKRYEELAETFDSDDLKNAMTALMEMDLRYDLDRVDIPTLIIQGTNDEVTPPGSAEYLAKNLSDARLELFEYAGHAPFLTAPDKFSEIVRSFIS